jgi:hypothetical protein
MRIPTVSSRDRREGQESDLRRRRLSKRASSPKLHLHPLVERRQGLQALVALEEVARAGDHQVQPGQLLLREHVHELAQCVERLLARLRVHALDGLDLVEHHHEPAVARLPEQLEEPGEERQRAWPSTLPLVPATLSTARSVWGCPASHARGPAPWRSRPRAWRGGRPAAPARRRDCASRGRRACPRAAAPSRRRSRVVLGDAAQPRDLVAHLVEPRLDDRLEGVGTVGRGLEPLDEAPVHRLEVVQRRVVDRDLHLGRGEPTLTRLRAEVARGERLAGAVLATNPLRETLAGRDEVELLVHRRHQRVEAGGEVLETLIRHEPAAERVHDRHGFRDNGHQRPSFAW